jgi:hypothetical protein
VIGEKELRFLTINLLKAPIHFSLSGFLDTCEMRSTFLKLSLVGYFAIASVGFTGVEDADIGDIVLSHGR